MTIDTDLPKSLIAASSSTTSLNGIGAQGANTYPLTDLAVTTWQAQSNLVSAYGSYPFQPTVGHLVDTTGAPSIGSTNFDYQIGLLATPVSFSVIFERAGLYVRTH